MFGSVYITTAPFSFVAIEYRAQKLKENIIIYEIGSEQKNIIEQMFKAAELLNLYDKNKTQLILISHGLIKLAGGEKFSTRKGNIIKLEEIIEESFKRSEKLLSERSINNKDSVEKIAIGAIKFNILKRHYSSDIIFESFSFSIGYFEYMRLYLLHIVKRYSTNILGDNFAAST